MLGLAGGLLDVTGALWDCLVYTCDAADDSGGERVWVNGWNESRVVMLRER